MSPNAPNHSYCLGYILSTPDSIKSKSIIKFRDAIITTAILKRIPRLDAVLIAGIAYPKKLPIKLAK